MRKRQRRQQRRVNHGEDGRGGADAKRQSRYDRNRQTGVLAQHAHAIAKILEQIPHGTSLEALGEDFFQEVLEQFPCQTEERIQGEAGCVLCRVASGAMERLFDIAKPCAIPDGERPYGESISSTSRGSGRTRKSAYAPANRMVPSLPTM